MYYIILLVYYLIGIIFFIINDYIIFRKSDKIEDNDLFENLLETEL